MPKKKPSSPQPAKKPLFNTLPHDVDALKLPRLKPRLALLLHGEDNYHHSVQARQIVATVHEVAKHGQSWTLSPGRLLDRAEELVIANDLLSAEPTGTKLQLYPRGLLHLDAASVTWHVPASVGPIVFRTAKGLREMTVPWPALVCHARGNALFVTALGNDAHPTLDHSVFHAPCANVYQDGKLCLGNIAPPRGLPLQTMMEWVRILKETPFTNANHGGVLAKRFNTDIGLFWQGLDGAPTFPLNALNPRKQTLGQWLNDVAEIGEDSRDVNH